MQPTKLIYSQASWFLLISLLCLTLSAINHAGVEVRNFDDSTQERRYHQLVDELRCLVCQNQNLADSNSQLALDLRDKIYEMVKTNKTDQEVLDYMVQRYGEFVLYNPPLDPVTSLLWLSPYAILLIAVVILLIYISNRNKSTPVELSEDDHKRSQQLLDDEENKP